MIKSIVQVIGVLVGVLMLAGAPVAKAGGIVMRLEAPLASSTAFKGKAAYVEEQRSGRELRQKFTVEFQNGVPGTTYTISINGGFFGTLTADALGNGKLEVRAGGDNPGAGLNVIPQLTAGDSVSVGTASGTLRPK